MASLCGIFYERPNGPFIKKLSNHLDWLVISWVVSCYSTASYEPLLYFAVCSAVQPISSFPITVSFPKSKTYCVVHVIAAPLKLSKLSFYLLFLGNSVCLYYLNGLEAKGLPLLLKIKHCSFKMFPFPCLLRGNYYCSKVFVGIVDKASSLYLPFSNPFFF